MNKNRGTSRPIRRSSSRLLTTWSSWRRLIGRASRAMGKPPDVVAGDHEPTKSLTRRPWRPDPSNRPVWPDTVRPRRVARHRTSRGEGRWIQTPQPMEPPRPNGIDGGVGSIPKTPAPHVGTGLDGLSGGRAWARRWYRCWRNRRRCRRRRGHRRSGRRLRQRWRRLRSGYGRRRHARHGRRRRRRSSCRWCRSWSRGKGRRPCRHARDGRCRWWRSQGRWRQGRRRQRRRDGTAEGRSSSAARAARPEPQGKEDPVCTAAVAVRSRVRQAVAVRRGWPELMVPTAPRARTRAARTGSVRTTL